MPFNPVSPSAMGGIARTARAGTPGSQQSSWGNLATMGAGAAGAAGGLPWNIILPILATLIPGLLSGGRDEEEADRFLQQRELDQMMRQQGMGK